MPDYGPRPISQFAPSGGTPIGTVAASRTSKQRGVEMPALAGHRKKAQQPSRRGLTLGIVLAASIVVAVVGRRIWQPGNSQA